MANTRRRVYSGSPWEQSVGYCRAIRVENAITVSGTVAVNDDGSPHAPYDAHAQTVRCYEIILRALNDLGTDHTCITRVRMFVTDISRSAEYGNAHAKMLQGYHPCMTMVEVSGLISPEFVVEIEVDGLVK